MLTQKSYARITLALDIIKKLTKGHFSGYHELNIIKHQINLCDTITLENSDTTEIICNNPLVPKDNTNLCFKAVDLLKNKFSINKAVKITIGKNIPVQAGLAGGSTNAATTLELLNKLWQINLSTNELIKLGRNIGMDVPFYFIGGTAFDTESTGILKKIDTSLKLDLVIAFPCFGVSTKSAYQNIDYIQIAKNTQKTENMKLALENNSRQGVIANLHNDFEISVFNKFPRLEQIKENLIKAGCLNAVLTGSGSAIIGIAEDEKHAKEIQQKLNFNSIISTTK